MDPFNILLATLAATVAVFLWYTMTYFRKTGIPHEWPLPIVGNMGPVLLRRKHMVHHVLEYYNRWKDAKYFAMYDFITPVIVIRDPELIKAIAVKNFDSFPDHRSFVDSETDPLFGKSLFSLKGDKWREVRKLLTPAFTASKMKVMTELMSKCAADFSEYLVEQAMNNDPNIEMKEVFTRYTNDVIASCAFGISVDSMRNPNNDFYVLGRQATNFSGWATLKMFFARFCPRLARMFKLEVFGKKITEFFKTVVQDTINTRDKQGIVRPDMLQLMMEARGTSSELDINDMVAQAFIFFFGGFDTSSSLMSFTAVALALYPDIQDKLIDEIDRVLEETNGNLTYEAINGMPYLEAVLYETLRFYPIAGFIDRMCTTAFELPPALPGAKPFVVKPGMNVWFASCGIHYDPQYYWNPDTFDPDRFLNKKITTNLSTYLSFGIGPRSCIGNRFALLENKLVLFHLLAKSRIEVSHKMKLPIKYRTNTFLILPEGGFWLKLVPRKKSK